MTKEESAIISAYTGIGFGGRLFSEFHKYIEKLLGRSVWTHELANRDLWRQIKKLSKADFLKLAESINLEEEEKL